MTAGGDPTNVVGRRIGAYVIDTIILAIIVVAVMVPKFNSDAETIQGGTFLTCEDVEDRGFDGDGYSASFCFDNGDELRAIPEDKEGSFIATLWLTAIGAQVLNFVLLQGLTGASLGKLMVGLRVVRGEDGRIANVGWAALRWVILIVDGIICGLLPGVVLVASTKGHRRLGDMAASTFVVRKDDVGRPVLVPGLTAAYGSSYGPGYTPPSYDAPGGWGAGGQAQPGSWGAQQPSNPSWGVPETGASAPTAPSGATPPSSDPTPGADSPTWDAARNAYIQYDRELSSWMQWDDATKAWKPISQ